jgi:uncharacterized protein (TIRG00374 family)
VTALSVVTLLGTVAGLVVLPLVVLVATAAGSSVDARLTGAMWLGAGTLAAVLGSAVWALRRDASWRRLAAAVAWISRRLRLPADEATLADRLLTERNLIGRTLRNQSLLLAVMVLARALGDYATLYIALQAVHAHVNPAAALAAFIVSNIAGLIPLTPGGLGFVEASLTGVLTLAGGHPHRILLAVALYRLAATWLPCLAGLVALIWFRQRHPHQPTATSSQPADPGPEPIGPA